VRVKLRGVDQEEHDQAVIYALNGPNGSAKVAPRSEVKSAR